MDGRTDERDPGRDLSAGQVPPATDGHPSGPFTLPPYGADEPSLFPDGPAHDAGHSASDDSSHLIFGTAADDHTPGRPPAAGVPYRPRSGGSRADRRRRRRQRRLVPLVALLVIGLVVGVAVVLLKTVNLSTPDYTGAGSGSVQVKVQSGDGADDIGSLLADKGVVKSARAFVNAAQQSGQADNIQPGVYRLPLHASGQAAMRAILDPANRLVSRVPIPEGSTYLQVLQLVGKDADIPAADLTAALANVNNLGIPEGFPTASAEGYLFPATYDVDPGDTASTVLQSMVAKFSSEAKQLDLIDGAKALKLSGYQVLIIASIAESEAKFPADQAKVARVIMNRIAAGRHLQVDATSAYAAKLAGKDPASVVYATLNSPYNSYTHAGLPPTPIGNPGAAAISAALNPPAGSWLYYVNVDAAGHLGFFTDEAAFEQAAAVCKAKNWGCG